VDVRLDRHKQDKPLDSQWRFYYNTMLFGLQLG